MIHELKTINPYFKDVVEGYKSFEFRKNDRDFKVCDELILKEYDPISGEYSGYAIHCDIIYILKDFEGISEGYCILGIGSKTVVKL